METVEAETDDTQTGQPPVATPNPQSVAQNHPAQPQAPSSSGVGSILGKLFKRNGRHPANCDCPIHRKADGTSRFSPPEVPLPDAPSQSFAPPAVPPNPRRFEVWGRLTARAVKTLYNWLTNDTPNLCHRAVKLGGMAEDEAEAIIKELPITDPELEDVASSATRLAEKYNLTTGFDEEIEFVVTTGSIFGRAFLVTRRLGKAVARLEAQAEKP